jgi:hypothetical protein
MKKLFVFAVTSLLLFTATIASAQSRRQRFKFQVTAVDAKTHVARSTFFLGESVAIRFSLTNQSRVARIIPMLPDTEIKYELHSMDPYDYAPDVIDGYFGGTGWVRQEGNMTVWCSTPPRMMTLAPGQTVSTIVNLRTRYGYPPEEGTHTLTVNYNPKLHATVSFRVIVDEAKTIPLLEQLAAIPVKDGNDTVQRWASISLKWIREPSISGRIVDTDGRPLKEDVRIEVTGAEQTNLEGRKSGMYRIELLKEGGTYTITPSLPYYNHSGVADYAFEPASKTITILNGKITDVNFIARKIPVEKNVALEDEGAKATASSIRDHLFETENIIDGFRFAEGWDSGSAGWNDGTPNAFPDWLEVDFGSVRRINWINVFTLPDEHKDRREPELNDKFSLYGITDFDVQYWTGRAWLTVPGGAIRNNRNVWTKVSFPELATRKIRVVVRNALRGESRITEIEAIHLNNLPTARIAIKGNARAIAKATAYTNSLVHFRADAFDRDGRIDNYELDFGDETARYEWSYYHDEGVKRPPLQLTHTHVYKSAGTYEVKLRVIDDNDESSETTLVLTIIDPPKTQRGAKPQ